MPARSQAGGLPSGPRARSHARGTRDDEPSDYPRQVRPQKSLVSMRTEDSGRRPPMSRPHDPKQHTSSPSSSSSSYRSDDTSSSSLMNRIRAGTGYSSSRTSIDDDRSEYAPKPQASSTGINGRDGSAIWNTFASAASSLTVNVGKAWASNVTLLAGEDTPPGAESRLTRAMKAYHREKASTPADLPDFLFDEHERRVVHPVREARGHTDRFTDEDDRGDRPSRGTPTRGLRDVYAAASSTPEQSRPAASSRRPTGDSPTPSRATDRLKAMRDAKRAGNQMVPDSGPGQDRYDTPRGGLPGGPGRRRF